MFQRNKIFQPKSQESEANTQDNMFEKSCFRMSKRVCRSTLTLIALLLFGIALWPQPAAAQDPGSISISVSVVGGYDDGVNNYGDNDGIPGFNSGDPITWAVQFECSGIESVCTNGQIVVPAPAGYGLDAAAHSILTQNYIQSYIWDDTNKQYIITLDPSLQGGSQSSFNITFGTFSGCTPDNSAYTLEATYTSPGAIGSPAIGDATAEVHARAEITAEKERLALDPLPTLGIPVVYTISLCDPNNIGGTASLSVQDVVLIDTLPAGATFVSASNNGVYNATNGTVTWDIASEFGNINQTCNTATTPKVDIALQYDAPAFSYGDQVTNQVDVSGRACDPVLTGDDRAEVTATDTDAHTFDQPIVDGNFYKDEDQTDDKVQIDESFNWHLVMFNDSSNVPQDITVYDDLTRSAIEHFVPTSVDPAIGSDPHISVTDFDWPGRVYYQTDSNPGVWVEATGGTATTNLVPLPDIAPAKYTQIRIDYLQVPSFRTIVASIGGYVDDTLPVDVTSRTNCAYMDYTYDGNTQSTPEHCQLLNVVQPTPNIDVYKYFSPSSPIAPGDTVDVILSLSNVQTSVRTVAPWTPIVIEWLPPGFDFVPGSLTYSAELLSAIGEPERVEVVTIADGLGRPRTTLQMFWPTTQTIGPGVNFPDSISLQVQAQPGLSSGSYYNSVYGTDGVRETSCSSSGDRIIDTFDLDSDGVFGINNNDFMCAGNATITVQELASADAVKYVKGSLDSDWSRYPEFGYTEPGGDADYRLNILNEGNVDLTDMVFYDILPYIGDTGVSGGQVTNQRDTEWTPTLISPVTISGALPPGVTAVNVYYSASTDPCRPEVYPSQDQGLCTNDWTTDPAALGGLSNVRSLKFELVGTIAGGESVEAVWDMQAPIGVQPGEIAWNSFAYTGKRADNNNADLLISEPLKVGITVVEADFGDLPDGYPVTSSEKGAVHVITVDGNGNHVGPYLGTVPPDSEEDGQHDADALGDDNDTTPDDEDGLQFVSTTGDGTQIWQDGANGGAVDLTVTGTGIPQLFIDFNGDGVLTEVVLRDASGQPITGAWTDTTQTVYFDVPEGTYHPGSIDIKVRVRVSTDGNLTAEGLATDGEIEDYIFVDTVLSVSLSYTYAEHNDNGGLTFIWETATETGVAGFKLYIDVNGEWVSAAPAMVPSQVIDSLSPQRYTYESSMNGERYLIEIVKVTGSSEQHGPFVVGEAMGQSAFVTMDMPVFLPIVTNQ